jgi:hypothetical protein
MGTPRENLDANILSLLLRLKLMVAWVAPMAIAALILVPLQALDPRELRGVQSEDDVSLPLLAFFAFLSTRFPRYALRSAATLRWVARAGSIVVAVALPMILIGWWNGIRVEPQVFALSAAFAWIGKTLLARLTMDPEEGVAVRGATVRDARDVKALGFKEASPSPSTPTIRWGGFHFDESKSEHHFCIVGATGSGKTLSLRHLLQNTLAFAGQMPDYRGLVYDGKRELLPILEGMGLGPLIRNLNPFDARSVAWDMAADVTSPAMSLHVATAFLSIEEGASSGANQYFSNASRAVLAGVLDALHLRLGTNWSLRDVFIICRDPDTLRSVLSGTPLVAHHVKAYLEGDAKTAANVRTSLAAGLSLYEPIAALWDRCTDRISIAAWAEGEGVLLLGNDETSRAPLDAVNQVLFKRAQEVLVNQQDSLTRRSWIILDELREAGKLEGLKSLITAGRSKGVRVVTAFQDIEGLRDAYGEKAANEVVGLCAYKAILRLDSPETATWASSVIGDWRALEISSSTSWSKDGRSESESMSIQQRQAVMPSEFLTLPPVGDVLSGYFITPLAGVFKNTVRFKEDLLPKADVAAFVPRPGREQYLQPFNESDRVRLRLEAKATDSSAPGAFKKVSEGRTPK